MELQQKLENVKKEIEDLGEQYSTIYKQVEERLQNEIKLLIETNLALDTQFTIKMRCLQRYRLDFDIYFSYENSKSFGTNIECRYCIQDYAIVNPTKEDVKLYINYACREVYKKDICGLDCIKVLGLLANAFDFVENNLWFLVNNKEFIELDNKYKFKKNELRDLEFELKQQELQEIKDKIKVESLFKCKNLPNHLYQIVKITNKYIHYEDYMILSETKLQLYSNTPRKMLIDDFVINIKWKDFYFLEN